MSSEKWNVRITLPGETPRVSSLVHENPLTLTNGFILQLDTRLGALHCFSTDAAHSWLTVVHPEPTGAQFELDLRHFPGYAIKKRGKKRAAAEAPTTGKKRAAPDQSIDLEIESPPAKKPKLDIMGEGVPVSPPVAASASEYDTTPKKKRKPSAKPRKKLGGAADSSNGGGQQQHQDTLSALLEEVVGTL
jgi:hypothetical protein